MNNRLQFRHHDQVFDTREAAIEYIQSQIRFAEEGLAKDDPSYGFSLLAEPTVLLYKNITEQDPEGEDDPHLIFVIGSKTNEDIPYYSSNRFCIIDIDKTEQEIADLAEELEKAIKSLTLIALSSDTLNFYAEKTEDGTYVSGDVKVAETHIFDDVRYKNNLMVTPDGLYIYVNLSYDQDNEQFTFTVSNADGTLTSTTVDLSDNHLIDGYYDKTDESIHLQMKEGEEIIIDCEDLIAEWGVEGDASRTPVVLTREEVDYDHTDEHHHVEPWQDVLRADVRIKDEEKVLQPNGTYKYEKDPRSTNILDRTTDGRYLYVDGKASNIIYYMNGEKSTVKAALDELQKIKLSSDSDNIIVNKIDGFFASSKLEYISSANKLIFKTSGHPDKEIQLNSVELFEHVYYDPTREMLVLTYKDSTGQTQFVEIPIGEMIRDWEWEVQNEGHNVKIVKKRNVSGNDKVSADAKIYDDPNNILVDRNHELFVRGTADNIKYENGTVKDALDGLKATDAALDNKINIEIARAEAAEGELEGKIGSGFTNDPHDNVTYKFEQLKDKVDEEADKLQNEIDRSTAKDEEHDGKIQAIEDEIGDGFGPRNTVRDEIDREKEAREAADEALQNEIDALSAETASKLADIDSDNSINIDKTEPTVPVISVNLSEEIEDDRSNIIKLNNDGLFATVDLSYIEAENQLIFHTSGPNPDKVIQLDSMSSIISIEYNPSKEAIVITYMTNGHEIKTVEIPVGDLINEWRVEDGHPHAVALEKVRIASGTSEQDVLKASVVITDDHDDNILVMDDGALYVPGGQIEQNTQDIAELKDRMTTAEGDIDNLENELALETERRISGDTRLEEKITTEEARARDTETRIENALNAEVTRATTREDLLEAAITAETLRAQAADNELYQKVADETADRANADAQLEIKINEESSARTLADNALEDKIDDEITRSTAEDERLSLALQQEIADRQQGDAVLAEEIRASKLTFEDTRSIDFNNPYLENNVVKADVKLQGGDNIIKLGSGLYATATLEYEPTGNKIRLVTSNGAQEYIQLVGATLLDSIEYDPTNKMLIIKYTDGTGSPRETSVGVTDLWNDLIVQNPSEKSAVEMTKTIGDPGNPDTLSARVLITDDRDGDGKPDEGSPNIVEIRNNGLFVDGSALSAAAETAECVQNELKVVEKAVLGHIVGEECGSGYTYEQNNMATYINTATSFYNADFILDQNIKRVENYVDEVSAKTDCVDGKADAIYKLLYGENQTMPDCGEGAEYHPYPTACVISAATSFSEADQLLNDQICQILTMWVSGITCTNESSWIEDGMNRKLQVDTRLSHGNVATMQDENLYIKTLNGDYIDPTNNEFTDTNALRIICLEEGPSGVTPSIDTKQNGIYLSNVWDCGLYYGNTPEDAEAKAKAQAAGYNTNYSTDEDSSAGSYNYMNNARQNDTLC
jgi:hypothetical protein